MMGDESLGGRTGWVRGALLTAVLAGLTILAFREAIGSGRLPGLDAPLSHAYEVYTRQALGDGGVPYWNPFFWSGVPHFANTLTVTFYPPALLLRWLDPVTFLQWMVVLHFVIGGAGTLFAARVIGLGWAAAMSAALAVTLGGAVGSWFYLGHLLIVYAVAWLPWILALAIVSVRRRGFLPHPALPLLLALQFMAGYLQISLYTTFAVVLYYLFSMAWPESQRPRVALRTGTQLAVLGVLCTGLTAVQLFPVLQLVAEMARTDGLSYERASLGGWTLRDLATFFWPFTGVDREPVYRYLSHRVAYVGWLLACGLPFALFDRGRRRMVVFLLLLGAVCAALAFGDNLPFYRLHYMLLPGLRVPGRILFIVTLCVALAGAIGLERLLSLALAADWRRAAKAAGAGVLLVAAASAVAWQNRATDATMPLHLWPWLPVAAVAGLAAVALLAARFGRLALIPAVAIVGVDVTTFAAAGAETVPVDTAERVDAWIGPADGGRIWSACQTPIGINELLIAGRPVVDGVNAVILRDFRDWTMMLAYAEDGTLDRIGPYVVRRDLLNTANVTTVIACEPVDAPGMTLMSNPPGPMFVYRNEHAWPRAVWTCGADQLPRSEVARQLQQARYRDDRGLFLQNSINVRWASDVAEEQRETLEARYALRDGALREGDTWRYRLDDISPANVLALLDEPAIEDTHGIDRASGELTPDAAAGDRDARSELLIGHCGVTIDAVVTIADRPDGRVVATVDAPADGGVVFFSEPFYPERRAFVDGDEVAAYRANLAFTVVPVSAGRHVVELRIVPRTLYAGAATTVLTLALWVGAGVTVKWGRRSFLEDRFTSHLHRELSSKNDLRPH